MINFPHSSVVSTIMSCQGTLIGLKLTGQLAWSWEGVMRPACLLVIYFILRRLSRKQLLRFLS